MVAQSTIIIEYLDIHHPGSVRLVPDDTDPALYVRSMDRFFDNDVRTEMQKPVFGAIQADTARKEAALVAAATALDTAPCLARRPVVRPHRGSRRDIQHGRLRCGSIALLRRLGARDRRSVAGSSRRSHAPARAAMLRAGRRRRAPLPARFPARCTRPRMRRISIRVGPSDWR
jgi:glutathione S-transferase